jgi:ribosomal protein L18E
MEQEEKKIEESKEEVKEKVKQYPEMTEEEKKGMWEQIAFWLSLTEEERVELKLPKFQREIYEQYGIPESTFYYQLQDEKYMRKLVKISLVRAKRILPKLIRSLEKNIEDGKEKSIEIGLKYIGEIADKIDHTTQGEKIGILELTAEQKQRIAEETLHYAKKQHDNRTTGDSEQQGTPDSVLSDDGQALPSELASSSVSGSVGAGGEWADQAFDRPDAPAPREESAQ